MAKLKCTGNFIHDGTRRYIGDEVDTAKDKIDAKSVKLLQEAGALGKVVKPTQEKPKEDDK